MSTTLFRGRFKIERDKVAKQYVLTDVTDGSQLRFRNGQDVLGYRNFAMRYVELWGDINFAAVPRTLEPEDSFNEPGLTAEQRVARTRFWERRNSTRAASSAAPSTRTCGNCRFIRYVGANEVTLYSGSCQRYNETRKACVLHADDASECPCWAPRGKNKIVNEQRQAVLMGERLRDAKISRRGSGC